MLLLCFLLSGCTGYREIDRGYFVTAIAFSKKDTSTTVYIEALSSSDITEEKDKKINFKFDESLYEGYNDVFVK